MTQTGAAPGEVTFTFSPAAGYVFPAGTNTSVTLTVAAQKTGRLCGEVLGTETAKPEPTQHTKPSHQSTGTSRPPTVLGTEAVAVPTAVDAGLATMPGNALGAGGDGRLAQLLLGGGLLLLIAGGWLELGIRSRGGHEF